MRFSVIKVDKMSDSGSICISCRSHEDGERHKLLVSDFKPYFYVPDSCVDITTAWPVVNREPGAAVDLSTKESVTRLRFPKISDIKPYRTKVPRVWEADVPYTQRFIIDTDCRGVIEAGVGEGRVHHISYKDIQYISDDIIPMRKWYLDIEVANLTFCRPEEASAPICSITIFDTFEGRFRTWAWNPKVDPKVVEKDFYSRALKTFVPWTQVWCPNSSELLLEFSDHANRNRPDLICGWNSIDYDMQYILNHARTRSLSLQSLGGRFTHFSDIPEIQQVDLLVVYGKQSTGELKYDTLGDVAKRECGIELVKDSDNILKWFEEDPEALVTYNTLDSDAAYAIDSKLELSAFALHYQIFAGVYVTMDIASASIVVDVAHLSEAKRLGWALPTRLEKVKTEGYKGAEVLKPIPGLHRYVAVPDFSRMYPSIIIGYNMSYETYGKPGIKVDNGATFDTSVVGLTPRVVKRLVQLRAEYDRKIKECQDISEITKLENKREPLKRMLNSIYGVMAYENYRLYRREVAECITFVGRQLILDSRATAEKLGVKTVYGDTDSIFLVTGATNAEDGVSIAKKVVWGINDVLDSRAVGIGIPKGQLSMDFEKLYDRLFLADAKKRYAGRVVWKKGKFTEPTLDIKGFEFKRSEASTVTATVQETVFDMLFRDMPREVVEGYMRQMENDVRGGKYTINQVAPCPKLDREPEQYANENGKVTWMPASAAIYSRENLGKSFRAGDRVYCIYVRSHPQDKPKTHVIGLKEKDTEMPAGWYVDWDLMAEKCVKDKTKRIVSGMGWDELGRQGSLW